MQVRNLFNKIFGNSKSPPPNQQLQLLKMISGQAPIFSNFGNDIYASDVVKICIDKIASQCAKLKPTHIIRNQTGFTVIEQSLQYLLNYKPNELMTTFDFIYKIITLLYLNNNVFIYPKVDLVTGEYLGLYPLNPITVELSEDSSNSIFITFYFSDQQKFTLLYESVIHLRKFYGTNDIMGDTTDSNESLLKILRINDSLLQGLENAIKSSMQIKGLLKINTMLNEMDKEKQRDLFDEALNNAVNYKNSAIIPIDLKADYIPLNIDPKLVDQNTLKFLQDKILNYFGVSIAIFNSSYNEDEYNSFYESTIEPLAISLSQAFTTNLFTYKEIKAGNEIVFYSERLQYASWGTKVNAIEKLMGLGIMTLNESRALLGLAPLTEGNIRLQSLNYVNAQKADQYQGVERGEEIGKGNKTK